MSVAIPYNVEPRPDTGLYNAKFGVWLFLASEVMLFGALFSAYVLLRTAHNEPFAEGHFLLSTPIAFFNTLVLIGSSVTMVMSWVSLKLKDFGKYRMYMGLTILCALVFLGVKAYEYNEKFSHGNLPSQSTFLAIYFTITGLHALHIIGGVIVNGYLWGPGAKMWKTEPERFTNRIEVAGLYWHFVDLVWIFLFPILYLLPLGAQMADHNSPEAIKASVRVYMMVFGALAVLTMVTVGVSYLKLSFAGAVAVALIVASFKASLVAMYFMHLKGEVTAIRWSLWLTAFFFVVLMILPIATMENAPGHDISPELHAIGHHDEAGGEHH